MKKYLALILAICMAITFAACSNDNNPTIENNEPSTVDGNSGGSAVSLEMFKGKLMEPYAKTIATGNYMFEVSADNSNPITLALYNGNVSSTTLMDLEGKGELKLVSFVKYNDKYYCVLPTEKAKYEMTKAEMEERNFTQSVNNAKLDNILTGTFVAEGTVTGKDGVTYSYEDYYAPVVLTTYRFFFNPEGQLVMFGAQISSEKDMRVMNIKFYDVTADTFNVISTYTDLEKTTTTNAAGTNQATAAIGQ